MEFGLKIKRLAKYTAVSLSAFLGIRNVYKKMTCAVNRGIRPAVIELADPTCTIVLSLIWRYGATEYRRLPKAIKPYRIGTVQVVLKRFSCWMSESEHNSLNSYLGFRRGMSSGIKLNWKTMAYGINGLRVGICYLSTDGQSFWDHAYNRSEFVVCGPVKCRVGELLPEDVWNSLDRYVDSRIRLWMSAHNKNNLVFHGKD